MKALRLFTSQTVERPVIYSLLLGLSLSFFHASAAFAADGDSATLGEKATCNAFLKDAIAAAGKFAEACAGASYDDKDGQECIKVAKQCEKEKKGYWNQSEGDDEDDSKDCSALLKIRCFDDLPTKEESIKDKKQSEKERKEAQEKRDKKDEDLKKSAKEARDAVTKADDEASKADEEYMKAKADLADKLRKDLKGVDDAKAKEVAEMQKAYDDMNIEYIKLRDQLRRKESEASLLDNEKGIDCIAAAHKLARDEEVKFDELMKLESARPRNYRFSNAASKKNSELRNKRNKILIAFEQFKRQCERGEGEPGTTITKNVNRAKSEFTNSLATAKEQEARLEDMKKRINEKYTNAMKSMDAETQNIMKTNAEQAQILEQKHNNALNRAQAHKMNAMQDAAQAQQTGMQAAAKADQEVEDAKKDSIFNSANARCAPATKEVRSDYASKTKSVLSAKKILDSNCASYRACSKNEAAEVCKSLTRVNTQEYKEREAASSSGKSSVRNPTVR